MPCRPRKIASRIGADSCCTPWINFNVSFAADKMSADVTVVEDGEQLLLYRIAPQ